MTLAGMLRADRDAVVCDLAETYGIFDYRALPVHLLATLASGLRDDSRIKMRLSGSRIPRRELLLAAAVDRLSFILWGMSEDAKRGTNRPESLVAAFMEDMEESGDVMAFDSADAFEAAWAETTGVPHG